VIELHDDHLRFSFSEVHPEARLSLSFQRTLRIPDDGRDYPLPPGLGSLPLVHVDDHAARVPGHWLERGGVILPMYQSEATWLHFTSAFVDNRASYPFLVKIACGKINAVTGEEWTDGAHRDPQDYLVIPEQPWLDGFAVEKGVIRQFVAMPLGSGYSAEEQLTGEAEWGGVQLVVYPMKRAAFERRFPKIKPVARRGLRFAGATMADMEATMAPCAAPDMGLAAGGRMEQEIYEDPFDFEDWDLRSRSRCFVHLANSMVWQAITGKAPPLPPPTAADYDRHGLPWFDYYSETPAVDGGEALKGLKSVVELAKEKGENPLPENESTAAARVIELRRKLAPEQVREW